MNAVILECSYNGDDDDYDDNYNSNTEFEDAVNDDLLNSDE